MNDNEYRELCSAIDEDVNARYECETYNAAYLENENDELRELIADMHALLQRCCDETEMGECVGQDGWCAMRSHQNNACNLSKIEDRMHAFGFKVPNE